MDVSDGTDDDEEVELERRRIAWEALTYGQQSTIPAIFWNSAVIRNLRDFACTPWPMESRSTAFDKTGFILTGLVRKGYPVSGADDDGADPQPNSPEWQPRSSDHWFCRPDGGSNPPPVG